MDAGTWIDLVITRAAELRAAGITEIEADGCSASLTPAPPPISDEKIVSDTQPDIPGNCFEDPASYPDGLVPGFKITKLDPLPR